MHEEKDLIQAYLSDARPCGTPNDTYSQVVCQRFDQLCADVDALEDDSDTQALLSVKQRLREYFEFSGKYLEGAELGTKYARVLRGLGKTEESIWTNVKQVAYLLLLAGHHRQGRAVIWESLEELSALEGADLQSIHKCLFYCHRYLGISYHRDPALKDLEKAKAQLSEAAKHVDFFGHDPVMRKELEGKLQGNLGNVALEERRYSEALTHYQRKLALSKEINDTEHIGIARLQIAQCLIASERELDEVPGLLDAANEVFAQWGWIEGQARVYEQRALYYECIAKRSRLAREKHSRIEKALEAIGRSEALMMQISLGSAVERLKETRRRLLTR